MHTFLPYPDYMESAKTLDQSRVGNQFYRECMTLIRRLMLFKTITPEERKAEYNRGWNVHPALYMWEGYEYSLGNYMLCVAEAIQLYHADHHHRYLGPDGNFWNHIEEVNDIMDQCDNHDQPWWLGNEDLHASHRAGLLFKDFDHYSQFGWTETPQDKNYVWPTKHLLHLR